MIGKILVGVGALVVFVVGVKYLDRTEQKFDENTKVEVYDSSRTYTKGTNKDLARYCYDFKTQDTDASRKAMAALIRSTAATYDGPLSQENKDCIAEANTF